MFKKTKTRNHLTRILAIFCCLSMIVSVFAFFTDRVTKETFGKVGNIDLLFTDISSSKTGDNNLKSNNEFAIDKSWENASLVSNGAIINPGDYFDLSYNVSNTGSKSMDVKQQLILTSTAPLTADAEEYKLTINGVNNDSTTVTGALSDDGYSITYDLEDIVLNGSKETETGITWDEETYTVRLDFDEMAKNEFMNSNVTVNYKAKAKQHRNTLESDWGDWLDFETKFEEVVSETGKAVGSYLYLTDVSETTHDLDVSLTSSTLTNFSDVTVTRTGKNLLNVADFTANNANNVSGITYDVETGSIEFSKISAPQTTGGVQVKNLYLPAGTYALSMNVDSATMAAAGSISAQVYKGSSNSIVTSLSFQDSDCETFTITEAGLYRVGILAPYSKGDGITISASNVQLEFGEGTEFEPYTSQSVTANADGSVEGLTSLPTMILTTDSSEVSIDCEYQKKKVNSNNNADSSLSKSMASMSDGDVITLESNSIKKNKTLYFTGNIQEMDTLVFRHGTESWGTGYMEINNTDIKIYSNNDSSDVKSTTVHNLDINGNTEITIVADELNYLTITITSNGETFTKSDLYWFGSRGAIEMESVNTTMTDVELTWECSDYVEDFWFFGDSYFELNNTRWPYYLLQEADNFLLSGFGGAKSSHMYEDWKTALTHGTPKYAVWCLGMNDADSASGINASWKTYVEKFISDCEELDIIPILTTIPNVPERINTYKNEYVRNSGYRYIDFASAVGANEQGSSWTEGMLHADQVHPTALGGKALADQILIDLPEIKNN